jgi:hypothetical protein
MCGGFATSISHQRAVPFIDWCCNVSRSAWIEHNARRRTCHVFIRFFSHVVGSQRHSMTRESRVRRWLSFSSCVCRALALVDEAES